MNNLIKSILQNKPVCQVCQKPANIIHKFLIQKDIKNISDFIPVCFSCEKEIKFAIEYKYISQNPENISEIKTKTLNILNDENYKNFKTALHEKRVLKNEEIDAIGTLNKAQKRKLSSVIKINIHENYENVKFTNKQLFQIHKLLNLWKTRK